MDTSVNAANQVVSGGADIAVDADPKFVACLVRFESSSVPTTLPTDYDVYPFDGRHDGGYFFFSSRRRHTRFDCDWSSDVCSSDLWPAFNVADSAIFAGAVLLVIFQWKSKTHVDPSPTPTPFGRGNRDRKSVV